MRIHILCTDGSPLGVTMKSLYGQDKRIGVGGAEYALLTMCEAWQKLGHEVVVHNDGHPGDSPFEHRKRKFFDPEESRDVLIIFRSPNKVAPASKGMKVWWSCDQYTQMNNGFKDFAPLMQKIVVISPFHQLYFKSRYGIENTIVTDLPVRLDDYNIPVEKVAKRCIWTSVPERGLSILARTWPRITERHPDASLVITSDYRLWGAEDPLNTKFRSQFMGKSNVIFRGAVKRGDLVREQLAAQYHLYSATYDELFCIAVAESQVAGVLPISNDKAALQTTNMGVILPGNAEDKAWQDQFVEEVDHLMRDRIVESDVLKARAHYRFDPVRIAKFWEKEVFGNG